MYIFIYTYARLHVCIDVSVTLVHLFPEEVLTATPFKVIYSGKPALRYSYIYSIVKTPTDF